MEPRWSRTTPRFSRRSELAEERQAFLASWGDPASSVLPPYPRTLSSSPSWDSLALLTDLGGFPQTASLSWRPPPPQQCSSTYPRLGLEPLRQGVSFPGASGFPHQATRFFPGPPPPLLQPFGFGAGPPPEIPPPRACGYSAPPPVAPLLPGLWPTPPASFWPPRCGP